MGFPVLVDYIYAVNPTVAIFIGTDNSSEPQILGSKRCHDANSIMNWTTIGL